MSLKSPNYVYFNGKKWEAAPAPTVNDVVHIKVVRHFSDIWLYYANVIDYARVVLGFLSFWYIAHQPASTDMIAALIMGNVLLDWVDGPTARYFGQCSLFGSGVDWLADVLAQVAIMMWAAKSPPDIPWFTTFQIALTCVEVTTSIFDYASTAMGVYPDDVPTEQAPWFARYDICTPFTNANPFCTICWLANTVFPLAVMLGWPVYFYVPILPFALAYAWHEVLQLSFILSNWQERQAMLVSKSESKSK